MSSVRQSALQEQATTLPFPDFLRAFPGTEIPFPQDVVETSVIRSDAGLAVFFSFLHDLDLPVHSHVAQQGMGIEGEMPLAIGGETRICQTGDSCSVPEAVPHGMDIEAGARIVGVFEESEMCALKN